MAPLGAAAMGAHSSSKAAPQVQSQGEHVPGEVLVQFQQGLAPAARDRLLRRLGMRVQRYLGGQNAYLVTIVDGSSVAAAIAKLEAQPEVRVATPNRLLRLHPQHPGQPGAGATPSTP